MRKIIPAVAAGVTALAVAAGTFGYVTANKDVTLSVDGAATEVTTMAGTVAEVLEAEGVVVGEHDVLAPAADTKLTDGTRIAVAYGRQVTVNVDGRRQAFWTTATNVDQALSALDLPDDGAELSTSRSSAIGRQGLTFDLATSKTVTITAEGRKRTVNTTAQTVGEALTDADIALDADDKLSTSRSTRLRDGSRFTVTDVRVKKVTTKRDVDFETVYRRTDELDTGDNKVETKGKKGVRTVVYTEVRHDGKLISRKKTSSEITTGARDKVVLVGTREPEPEPEEESESGSSGKNFAGGSTVWDRLAQCESGGNWAINTGNGYSGGLQFLASTWRAYGGSGAAHNASRAAQIRVAERIRADVGYGAWPACSRKLGLL